jgi:hypothetical protein
MEPLSVEEVMFALIHEGRPSVAEVLVGRMRRAGMTTPVLIATLRAAQHSLLARGLLNADSESLSEPLRTVAQGVAGAASSIGFRRPGQAAYIYFGPDGTFEQTVDEGVVHTLRPIEGRGTALDRALDLFDIDASQEDGYAEFDIPPAVFDEIKRSSNDAVAPSLERASVPKDSAVAFAEDLAASTFRGDIVHAVHDPSGRPRVDGHMLILRGPRRAWLVRASEQQPATSVSAIPLSPDAFRHELAAFIQ